MKKQLLILCLLIPTAFAQLQISGFLYDPGGADSGYEWVELYNPTNQSLSLQNYSLWAGNGANQNDWTLRYNGSPSVVNPGHYFLLGESFIQNADLEITLGLQNGPDAIRLNYLNETIETIGWGEHEFSEYYQNSSLADVSSQSYIRVNTTGVNGLDFISSETHQPRNSYYNASIIGDSDDEVTVIYDVLNYEPHCDFSHFITEDMSHEVGLQLYPFTNMFVESVINISDFNGIHDITTIVVDEYEFDFDLNNSAQSYLYSQNFRVMSNQPAGIYTHSFSVIDSQEVSSETCSIYYEILPVIGIESDSVTYMQQKNNTHHSAWIHLNNSGNVALNVTISIEDITQFGLSIAFDSLELLNQSLPVVVQLPINSSKTFELTGKPTFGLKSGSYAAKLYFIAQDAS